MIVSIKQQCVYLQAAALSFWQFMWDISASILTFRKFTDDMCNSDYKQIYTVYYLNF